MNSIARNFLVVLLATPPLSLAHAQVPSILNYQGRVTVAGTNLTTNAAQFKFALVDGNGTTAYWKNDGTTTTNEPLNAVTVAVAQGLYSTLLGDVSLSNMAAIPGDVFTNVNVNLRVWFSPGGTNPFVQLTPDQRLGASGYALRAAAADSVVVTNISGNLTVSGTLIAGQLVGGSNNTASYDYAAALGGLNNTASGWASFVGGGQSNVASGNRATVGGGWQNTASGWWATVGGGLNNMAGDIATVGGGNGNTASGYSATVGGGLENTVIGYVAAVGGGRGNTASGPYATVGGGNGNTASGLNTTVGGGGGNTASDHATVGGGGGNTADAFFATVGGGSGNTANAYAATVGGGNGNMASGNAAAVGGGWHNTASGLVATVSGGEGNIANAFHATVGGGWQNTATGHYAMVGGGWQNTAGGDYATVGGGFSNTATTNAFAAGTQAKATNSGAFVWSDNSSENDFGSTANNQFLIRAAGGLGINTNNPGTNALSVAGSASISGNLNVGSINGRTFLSSYATTFSFVQNNGSTGQILSFGNTTVATFVQRPGAAITSCSIVFNQSASFPFQATIDFVDVTGLPTSAPATNSVLPGGPQIFNVGSNNTWLAYEVTGVNIPSPATPRIIQIMINNGGVGANQITLNSVTVGFTGN
jgi:hypothetical protein